MGVDVNQRSWHFRNTALMLASQEGHSSIVNMLLEAGADVHLKNETVGITALGFAVNKSENPERTAIVEALVNAGANVNAPWQMNGTWRYPLLEAIKRGETAVVNLLLEAGADVGVKTSDGHTAYSLAVYHNFPEIMYLLEQKPGGRPTSIRPSCYKMANSALDAPTPSL